MEIKAAIDGGRDAVDNDEVLAGTVMSPPVIFPSSPSAATSLSLGACSLVPHSFTSLSEFLGSLISLV